MKPTDIQIEIIDSIISIIQTWRNSNDIDSPTHYTYIEEELFSNLDGYIPNKQREYLENELSKLLDRVQKNKYCVYVNK